MQERKKSSSNCNKLVTTSPVPNRKYIMYGNVFIDVEQVKIKLTTIVSNSCNLLSTYLVKEIAKKLK